MASILVADDEAGMRYILRHHLQSEGHTVREAGSGEEALARARAEPPDLILLDVNMPGGDGLECVVRMRQEPGLEKVPIIILTGLTRVAPGVMRGWDVQEVLTKPLSRDELLRAVRHFLPLPPARK